MRGEIDSSVVCLNSSKDLASTERERERIDGDGHLPAHCIRTVSSTPALILERKGGPQRSYMRVSTTKKWIDRSESLGMERTK